MSELRVLFHAHVCPDCGSDNITESEVETGDGITEIALTCHLEPSEDPRAYGDYAAEFPIPTHDDIVAAHGAAPRPQPGRGDDEA